MLELNVDAECQHNAKSVKLVIGKYMRVKDTGYEWRLKSVKLL